jgi:SAM-dependent methyltransferase
LRREHVVDLYDDDYAASYEAKFLLSDRTRSDSEHELSLLNEFLRASGSWLDVACGTGYFLRQFPDVERAGLDISPAMLRRAREGNPSIQLVLHDFRDPLPAWAGRWDLVTCMWYAYGLVDTVEQVLEVIHNLWSWTSPAGLCFVPLLDTRMITGVPLPYRMPYSETSHVEITGIVWSYVEEDEQKVHVHQIAPNVEFMQESFGVYFENVEIVRYPPLLPGGQGRPALLASGKRPITLEGGAAESY